MLQKIVQWGTDLLDCRHATRHAKLGGLTKHLPKVQRLCTPELRGS